MNLTTPLLLSFTEPDSNSDLNLIKKDSHDSDTRLEGKRRSAANQIKHFGNLNPSQPAP